MSTITALSETDVRLMLNLANPEKVSIRELRGERTMAADGTGLRAADSDDDDAESEPDEDAVNETENDELEDDAEEEAEADEEEEPEARADREEEDGASTSSASTHGELPPRRDSRREWEDRAGYEEAKTASAFQARVDSLRSSAAKQTPKDEPSKSESTFQRDTLEKQSVLLDMERLKMQGISLSKEYTVEDNLADMQFEMRRHTLHLEEMNNVNFMRDSMRLLCTGIEMANNRYHLLELNGWANDVCKDMNKYDPALGRIYKKYWRRSPLSQSPEMEIAMGVLGSMGMHHFKKKLSSKFFAADSAPNREHSRKGPSIVEDFDEDGEECSDDEELPKSFDPNAFS